MFALALLRFDRLDRLAGLGRAGRLVGPNAAARAHGETAHRLGRATRHPAEGLTADGAPIVEVILVVAVATAFSSLPLLDDDQATALIALVPAEVVVVVFAAPALVEHVPAHRALVEKVQGLGA